MLRGTSRRYTYFRFRPDLTLRGRPAPGAARRREHSAIGQKREWILRKYEEMQKTRRILDDERVMFDGRLLDIVYEKALEKEEITPRPRGREGRGPRKREVQGEGAGPGGS